MIITSNVKTYRQDLTLYKITAVLNQLKTIYHISTRLDVIPKLVQNLLSIYL